MTAVDALFQGELIIRQPEKGYRFSIDAVLLAGLTKVRPNDRVMDLGTGCGVVPLIFAYRHLGAEIAAWEIQPELAELARQNVLINGFSGIINVHEGDFRLIPQRMPAGSFGLVVSNPPYRCLHSGRLNPDGQRAVARHELKASLADVCKAAAHLLNYGGRLALIYPAARLGHLLHVVRDHGLTPRQLTVIHTEADAEACLICLESRKGTGEELRIQPPFFIYEEGKTYSEAMRLLYADLGQSDRMGARKAR